MRMATLSERENYLNCSLTFEGTNEIRTQRKFLDAEFLEVMGEVECETANDARILEYRLPQYVEYAGCCGIVDGLSKVINDGFDIGNENIQNEIDTFFQLHPERTTEEFTNVELNY